MANTLIQIDGNVNYLEILYPEDKKPLPQWSGRNVATIRYDQVKRVYMDDDETVILIVANNPTKELRYWEVENPDTPGYPFYSGNDLYEFIMRLLGATVDLADHDKLSFIFNITTPSNNFIFVLPVYFDYFIKRVDWGDGIVEVRRRGHVDYDYDTGDSANHIGHPYALAGDYTIRLEIEAEQWSFLRLEYYDNSFSSIEGRTIANTLTSIDQSYGLKINDFHGAFYYCENLTKFNAENLITSDHRRLVGFIGRTGALTALDTTGWDLSNIEDLSWFACCSGVHDLDVANWNLGKVTNFKLAFGYMSNITKLDTHKWDMSNAYDLTYIFSNSVNLERVETDMWKLPKAQGLWSAFRYTKLKYVNTWEWELPPYESPGAEACYGHFRYHEVFHDALEMVSSINPYLFWKNSDGIWLDGNNSHGYVFANCNKMGNFENLFYDSPLIPGEKYWQRWVRWGDPTKISNSMDLTFRVEAGIRIVLPMPGFNNIVSIDWGDGTVYNSNTPGYDPAVRNPEHLYTTDGDYKVQIVGKFDTFSFKQVDLSKDRLIGVDYVDNLDNNPELKNVEGFVYECRYLEYVNVTQMDIVRCTSLRDFAHGCWSLEYMPISGDMDVSHIQDFRNMASDCRSLRTYMNPEKIWRKAPRNALTADAFTGSEAIMNFDEIPCNWGGPSETIIDLVIQGEAIEGHELHVQPKWTDCIVPPVEVDFTYQWYRFPDTRSIDDRVPIDDATAETYTVTADDVGFQLVVGIMYHDREYLTAPSVIVLSAAQAAHRLSLVIETTGFSEYVEIPITGTDYIIDWGDGNFAKSSENNPGHTYAFAGQHTVNIYDEFYPTAAIATFSYKNSTYKDSLIAVNQFGGRFFADLDHMFDSCTNVMYINAEDLDVSNNTDFSRFVRNCPELVELKVGTWNTQLATSFAGFCSGCENLLNLDVSNWKTYNVTSLSNFASHCTNLRELHSEQWNTALVENFGAFVYKCTNLTYLGTDNWDVSSAKSLRYFASNCSNLTYFNTDNWDLSNVEQLERFVNRAYKLKELNTVTWTPPATPGGVNMNYFAARCYDLESYMEPAVFWNNPNIASFEHAFTNDKKIPNYCEIPLDWNGGGDMPLCASGITIRIENDGEEFALPMGGTNDLHIEWGDGNVEDTTASNPSHIYTTAGDYTIYFMGTATEFNFNSSPYASNLIRVETLKNIGFTAIDNMFSGCTNVEYIDVEDLNVSQYTTINNFAYGCTNLQVLKVGTWDTSNVTSLQNFARGCINLVSLDVRNWDVSNVTRFDRFIRNCKSIIELDVALWDTGSAESLREFATYATALQILNVANWNTENVSDFSSFASHCESLIGLDVSRWDVSSGVNFGYFARNTPITILDVSGWDVSQAETFYAFAYTCPNLTTLDVSRWDTVNVKNLGFFAGLCPSLRVLDPSAWNVEKVNFANNFTAGCSSLTELNVNNWNLIAATNVSNFINGCANITEFIAPNFVKTGMLNIQNFAANCPSLVTLDASNWDTSTVQVFTSFVDQDTNLENLYIDSWRTPAAIYLNRFATDCAKLTTINTTEWDITNVTTMYAFITRDYNLETLDTSNWSTVNDVNFSHFASGCRKLRSWMKPDVFWENPNVTQFSSAFLDAELVQNYCDIPVSWGGPTEQCFKVTVSFGSTTNFIFPAINAGNNFIIRWGEGNAERVTAANPRHTYEPGTYSISVSGYMPQIDFSRNDYLIGVDALGSTGLTTLHQAFRSCHTLKYFNAADADVSNVTSISGCLAYTFYLDSINVDNWDLINCTDASEFMYSVGHYNDPATFKTADFSTWTNTHNITNFKSFAGYCFDLETIDVTGLVTSAATSIANFFEYDVRLATIVGLDTWDTSNVTDFSYVFYRNEVLTAIDDISGWDTSNATTLASLLLNCHSLQSIEALRNWVTDSVVAMNGMLYGCDAIQSLAPIENWNVSNVTNLYSTFGSTTGLVEGADLSGWNISNVTTLSGLFSRSSIPWLDIHTWHSDVLDSTSYMFRESGITELSMLDIGAPTGTMAYMFYRATKLKCVPSLNTTQATSKVSMFTGCAALQQPDSDTIADLTDADGAVWDSKPEFELLYNHDFDCGLTLWNDNPYDAVLTDNGDGSIHIKAVEPYGCICPVEMPDLSKNVTYRVTINVRNIVGNGVISIHTDAGWQYYTFNTDEQHIFDFSSSSTIIELAVGADNDTNFECDLDYISLKKLVVLEMYVTTPDEPTFDVTPSTTQLEITEVSSGVYKIVSPTDITQLGFTYGYNENVTKIECTRASGTLTTAEYMFEDLPALAEIIFHPDFNISNVGSMEGMFDSASSLTELDMSMLDISSATSMGYMFYGCNNLVNVKFPGSIGTTMWDNITDFSSMFRRCYELRCVNYLNTTNATATSSMFRDCDSLLQPNTTEQDAIVNHTEWEYNPTKCITTIRINFVTSTAAAPQLEVTAGDGSFTSIRTGVDTWTAEGVGEINSFVLADYAEIDKITEMHLDYARPGMLTGLKTLLFTNYQNAAVNMVKFSVGENFDTSNVTTLFGMLGYGESLVDIDLSNLDTSNVSEAPNMFYRCLVLEHLDTSMLPAMTGSMARMFYQCYDLVCITALNTTNASDKADMFVSCNSLTAPDTAAQADLTDSNGADWVNQNSCP